MSLSIPSVVSTDSLRNLYLLYAGGVDDVEYDNRAMAYFESRDLPDHEAVSAAVEAHKAETGHVGTLDVESSEDEDEGAGDDVGAFEGWAPERDNVSLDPAEVSASVRDAINQVCILLRVPGVQGVNLRICPNSSTLMQGIKRASRTGTASEGDWLYQNLHFDHLFQVEKYSSRGEYFHFIADLHTKDLGGESVMAEVCEHHLRDVLRLDLGAREGECPWMMLKDGVMEALSWSETYRLLRVSKIYKFQFDFMLIVLMY